MHANNYENLKTVSHTINTNSIGIMSSGGSNTSAAALKTTPNSITISVNNANNSGGGGSANSSTNSSISLTPRFTNEEKDILYSLFHLHEEVIDIKYRKKHKGKYSVREAWQQIVDGFNGDPNVSTQRNLKQIQKFWLNARLRKQYPFQPTSASHKVISNRRPSTAITVTTSAAQQDVITVPAPIKCEPDYALANSDTPDTTHNNEEYEEIELHTATVGDQLTVNTMEDPNEAQQLQQQAHQIQQQINQQQAQQQQQSQTTIQAQQISVDQISAEKLTLNDLLHFKTTRPRDEIILQIKHPDGGSITLPSPTRITIPQQSTYNQIIGELKSQNQTQHTIQVQQYQTQQIQQQTAQQVTQQQQIQQQYATTPNSTYCTYTTQNLPQVTSPTNITSASNSGTTTSYVVTESFDDKINYFKLKEAELRYKEVQLELEQKRIALSRMQEELKHQKEMHRLQVDEMRIKIRILSEEEKRLRNKES